MIRGANGQARWHELWTGLPYIYGPNDSGECDSITNGSNARPYIEAKSQRQWTWREYRPPRGDICLNREQTEYGSMNSGRLILQPQLKHRPDAVNKSWPWRYWNKLAWLLQNRGLKVTQIGPSGTPLIDAVEFIETRDFRHAAAVISKARLLITQEGGCHHLAAVYRTKAVVIFGGFISPAVTGYEDQVNLFVGDGLGCGMRVPCDHCEKAMRDITPEKVETEALRLL
jgi:ADP-heptose:LPS heptosyltransferase